MTLRVRALRAVLLALTAAAAAIGTLAVMHLDAFGWPSLVYRPYLTVIGSAVLLTGSVGALRGRTWGLMLLVLAATAFGGVTLLGVAPWWYALIAAGGVTALGLTAAPLYRRDPLAFLALAAFVLLLGVGAALVSGPGVELLHDQLARS